MAAVSGMLCAGMNPSDDEARSAMFNMGCALAKQKQWASAAEAVVTAINKYQLKLVVALKVRGYCWVIALTRTELHGYERRELVVHDAGADRG